MAWKDTLAVRWARLEPHITSYGPDDQLARPAVLLFHGCGGVRQHMTNYAKSAAEAGWRAFVVDSYAARGWSRPYALCMVCTGLRFRGDQRTGDILGALHGISQRPDVDRDQITLAGWSHGSWSIMDLMTMPLTQPGEADLANPDPKLRDQVRATFLVYPYIGAIARTRHHPWRHQPMTFGLIAAKDHITSAQTASAVYANLASQQVPIETWTVRGTHAFDEPGTTQPMRFDDDLNRQAQTRWIQFLRSTTGPGPVRSGREMA